MKVYTFFNKQRTRADGDIPIYVCVSRPPKRFYIQTGLFTKTVFIDDTFPRSERNSKAKTTLLREYLEKIERIVLENSLMPEKELKSLIYNKVFDRGSVTNTIYSLLKKRYESLPIGGTRNLYYNVMNKVEEYDKNANLSITSVWLEKFCQYYRDKGISENTLGCYMNRIRAIFNEAIKNELTTNYPFKSFTVPKEATRKRNLPVETIRQMISTELTGRSAESRDMFMLMLYLIGINSKDLLLAKKSNLVNGRLEYKRAKTGKLYSVKVEPEAMEIIDRYSGNRDFLLRFCEDGLHYHNYMAYADTLLKRTFGNVTTYYSRHTWASLASELDVPIDTISAALGHSHGAAVTNIYINFDEKKVDDANRKVIDYIEGKKLS